jgi:hypothetical protein
MASGGQLAQICFPRVSFFMNSINLDEHFLWASVFWSAIASGYWIYGWKQKSWIPLAGGGVMMAVSFFMPALTMSLVCLLTMYGVWWLMKRY